jgi:hypothetical protein
MPHALHQAFTGCCSVNILSQNFSCVIAELESWFVWVRLCREYISWTLGVTGFLDFVHRLVF